MAWVQAGYNRSGKRVPEGYMKQEETSGERGGKDVELV